MIITVTYGKKRATDTVSYSQDGDGASVVEARIAMIEQRIAVIWLRARIPIAASFPFFFIPLLFDEESSGKVVSIFFATAVYLFVEALRFTFLGKNFSLVANQLPSLYARKSAWRRELWRQYAADHQIQSR